MSKVDTVQAEEIFDVPVDVSAGTRAALWLFVAVMASLAAWGVFANLSEGAIAMGEVIPQGRSKTVQHLDGGIIREIRVRDGDAVKQGQELVILDDSEARAAAAITETELASYTALLERLTAERDGKIYRGKGSRSNNAIDDQIRIFDFRRQSMQKEIDSLQARLANLDEELRAWESRSSSLTELTANAEEERKQNQLLYEQKFISRSKLLTLNSQRSQTLAAQGETEAEIARANQHISDTKLQISKLKNDWMNAVLDQIRQAQDAWSIASEKARVARDRLDRTRIRSPQDGIVKGLRTMTLGAVIPPGGVVLEIVPVSDKMEVEVRVNPDDIDVVKPGAACRVRFTAYKARSHLRHEGVVKDVSPATFQDDKTGAHYYAARIEVLENALPPSERLALYPGMLAEVEFTGNKRSPLRYLVDPIVQNFTRAFKEE
ncbi:MAG: HlyD family type I secretion periplasmic adaptor subunit [Thiobacillus sp.]|nr:HlyD family type I secretion periplasmic adaptor subunit [Thiobacillus sp.]